MTRVWMLGLVMVAAGCAAEDVSSVESRVVEIASAEPERPHADVLLVVDQQAADPQAIADALVDPRWLDPSLHVGVASTDLAQAGVMRGPPGAAFLVDTEDADGPRTRNYAGELATALAGMLDVGIAGTGADAAGLQRAAQQALAAHPDFLRADAAPVIVVVTAGDAPAAAIRAALAMQHHFAGGCPCLPPLRTRAPSTPGPLYSCELAVTLDGRDGTYAQPVPLCPAAGPCVDLRVGCCGGPPEDWLAADVVGLGLDYQPALTGQCLAAD